MSLPAAPRTVSGTWIRHVPHGADLLGRASPPANGRWQRGDVVAALYLADSTQTATAEWYRALAERGFAPTDFLPYDLHRWQLHLDLADLSDSDRLAEVGLDLPRPSRHTWPAFQQVGERLWREGWAGLIAPSAARPASHIVCVFAADWPPRGCVPLDATTVGSVPPPPPGMTT